MAYYPKLNARATTRAVVDAFYGYRRQLRIKDGEFYSTKNLTTEDFPVLSSRRRRGVISGVTGQGGTVTPFTALRAIIGKDALYYVDGTALYANGSQTPLLTGLQTQYPTQLVSMGAYICVFPDKMYVNTLDYSDKGSMGASWTYTGAVTYSMCGADGVIWTNVTKDATEPTNPVNGAVWIDTADGSTKVYSSFEQTWTVLETVYTRLDFSTEGQLAALFKEMDGVTVSGAHFDDLNGSKILYGVGQDGTTGKDYCVVIGVQETPYTEEQAAVTITRSVPDMDYVCECQNRLWGCRYGYASGQTINELYACALGDFKNWEQYLGVSTDSWRASRGSDGPFTGCINYLGTPTFFKENVIHPVTVSAAGAHQVDDIPARGVQKESWRSLAVVGETLYYKSRAGVMAYQGGMPACVSDALGEEKYYEACAGVFGERYFISMKDALNAWHFFCYDAGKGLWMHEDELHATGFARVGDELFCVSADNRLIAINGTSGTAEAVLNWFAESGMIWYEQGVKGSGTLPVRYISRFDIRAVLTLNSQVQCYVEYDSDGTWRYYGTVQGRRDGTAIIPVRPRRCDHLRLRLEGSGDVKILSVAKVLERGSDVP